MAGALGAVVALVSGVVGLAVLVWPNSSPKPEISGRITEVTLGPLASARAYLEERNLPTERYTQAELATLGRLIRVRVAVRGLAGETLPLTWSLRRESEGTAVLSSALMNGRAAVVKPLATSYEAERSIWIPAPHEQGKFLVELGLFFGDRELDSAETKTFSGLGVSQLPRPPPPKLTPTVIEP